MSDRFTDRLSDYLDGHLEAGERHELEAHLETCSVCSSALEDLRGLVGMARALPDRPPAADLWPGIAARIGVRVPRSMEAPVTAQRAATRRGLLDWLGGRITVTFPQAAAAAAILVALAGVSAWLAFGRAPSPASRDVAAVRRAPAPTTGADAGGPTTAGIASGPALAATTGFDPRYDATIAELQRVLAEERSHLDPSTVRVLERNLAIIDQSVAEARRAVEADPSNVYLRNHLASVMKRKADLLRTPAMLAGSRAQEG